MRLSTRPEGFHKLAELQRLCFFSTAATRSLVVRNIKLFYRRLSALLQLSIFWRRGYAL